MHGHNYEVEITVIGSLDPSGFIIDFFDLDKIVCPIVASVDHRTLNDVHGLENPTAELIALWFIGQIPLASHVRVYETKDCWSDVHASNK